MDAMTTTERATLQAFEGVIEKGLASFVEVGNALMRIRDSRLYRGTHETFEAYCAERWGMSDIHARRLVNAASVVETIPIGMPKPATESQARPLTKLPPEEQAEAWQEAVETAPKGDDGEPVITAKHVESVVRERLPKDDKPASQKPKKQPKPSPFDLIIAELVELSAQFEDNAEPCDEAERVFMAFDELHRLIEYYARNCVVTA